MALFGTFFEGKRVLVTGHTGFKGSWLCQVLSGLGAEITGFALAPEPGGLYEAAGIGQFVDSRIGDIRDFDALRQVFIDVRPEIVIHLAAQPLVGLGYREPRDTYEINVMGTVNILECIHESEETRSILNVTTDKVYLNREWEWGYRETDPLDGFDPYSNSKSCSELVTHSYFKSFLWEKGIAVSTARAGNVIGGGDWAEGRIVPDCVRAAMRKEPIRVRRPNSIRPYQHVLEPLCAYLMLVKTQYEDQDISGSYNIGPSEEGCVRTERLVQLFCDAWGEGASWFTSETNSFHEASFLKLDCARIAQKIGWHPIWDVKTAICKTVEWTRSWLDGKSSEVCMRMQIDEYMNDLDSEMML